MRYIDIRTAGSGNAGATNVLRVVGKTPALITLIVDILKGVLVAAVIAPVTYPYLETLLQKDFYFGSMTFLVIAGHIWPVFLKFKGGKGVATSLGVLLGLTLSINSLWLILFLSLATWVTVFIFTRIVSLASVLSALSLPLYTFIFSRSLNLLFVSMLLSVFTLIRHKPNIQRLLQGKEKRFSTRKAATG